MRTNRTFQAAAAAELHAVVQQAMTIAVLSERRTDSEIARETWYQYEYQY